VVSSYSQNLGVTYTHRSNHTNS